MKDTLQSLRQLNELEESKLEEGFIQNTVNKMASGIGNAIAQGKTQYKNAMNPQQAQNQNSQNNNQNSNQNTQENNNQQQSSEENKGAPTNDKQNDQQAKEAAEKQKQNNSNTQQNQQQQSQQQSTQIDGNMVKSLSAEVGNLQTAISQCNKLGTTLKENVPYYKLAFGCRLKENKYNGGLVKAVNNAIKTGDINAYQTQLQYSINFIEDLCGMITQLKGPQTNYGTIPEQQ